MKRIARSLLLAAAIVMAGGCATSPTAMTVATFNLWGAGTNRGESIDTTVAALRAIDADIVALQEVRAEGSSCSAADCPPGGDSVAADLAGVLDYHVFEQPASNDALWANAILSRYPIAAPVAVAGESTEAADIVVEPWPSDHRAVVVTVEF